MGLVGQSALALALLLWRPVMRLKENTFITAEGHTVRIKQRYDDSQTILIASVPLMLSPPKTVRSYKPCETGPVLGGYVPASMS